MEMRMNPFRPAVKKPSEERKTRRPVVFIAGPMTGVVNANREAFNAEARRIEENGFTVLNPAVLPDGLEHHEYMVITLAMLEQADIICLLDGWENSAGAKTEFARAIELRLAIMAQSWEAIRPIAACRTALLPRWSTQLTSGIRCRVAEDI
jgi:hypothetical protein